MDNSLLKNQQDSNFLFNRKFIKKSIDASTDILNNGEIPAKHKKLIEKRISNHAINKKTKEISLSHDFLVFFKELLGYKSLNDTKSAKQWDVYPELNGIDYALGEFSTKDQKVIVPFELKGPDTTDLTRKMKGRDESTLRQALRYANDSQGTAKWLLMSNCIEVRLYKFPESTLNYEQWFIEDLTNPDEYARFILLLRKANLLSGNTEKLFLASEQQDKEISDKLYYEYRQLRIDLINGLKKENNSIRRKSMVRLSQKLLDRMLFIAFAEDRGLLPRLTLHDRISVKPSVGITLWVVIKQLFIDIDKGNNHKDVNIPAYNGGLFAPDIELESLNISDELLQKFQALYSYDFDSDIGTPILGHIFEQSIADLDDIYNAIAEDTELQNNSKVKTGTSGKRKKDGIVYTPEFITEYIIQQTLGGYLDKQKNTLTFDQDSADYWRAYRDILASTRILDAACGSGAFLIGAFKYLKAEYRYVNQRINELDSDDLFGIDLDVNILNNNLFGVDLNSESIEITQLALWLETAEKGKKLNPLDENIQQGNSIIHHKHSDKQAFQWNVEFHQVIKAGGFDVILGNPPYVRQERLTDIKPYLEEHYKTYHGVADLYTYFFELGINLLKKGGHLGYISSSTFFRTNSGAPLRDFLKLKSNLISIIDFNDYQVFEGVTTYPAILILEKPVKARKQAPKSNFSFLNITAKKQPQHTALIQQMQMDFGVMKQASLKADAWQLEDERLAKLRDKITKGRKTLKEVYGSPLYGIKTGFNEAFVINQQQYELLKQDDPKGEILKPFLEGKDLKRWRAESRGLYLIFTRRGVDIDAYPLIKAHLDQFKERLEPKPKDWPKGKLWSGRKAGPYQWYEIQDTVAYFEEFEKDKITWGNLQNSPAFVFDKKQYFINAPSPILVTSEEWVVGYLNSNVVWFILLNIAIARSGGFIECKPIYINQIPIPLATEEQKKSIADLVKKCQTVAKSRYDLEQIVQHRFIENLRPENNVLPLNTKMKQWWKLETVTELRKEARKAFKLKKAESLKEDLNDLDNQDKWEKYLKDKTQEWQGYTQKISGLEQQINEAVYALFKLTDNEIKLLEHSVR